MEAGAVVSLALLGCLGAARALNNVGSARLLSVTEDEDNVGYFLGDEDQDFLPTCPDYIPDWMMEEFHGNAR